MRNCKEFTRRALIAGAAAWVATPARGARSARASEGFARVPGGRVWWMPTYITTGEFDEVTLDCHQTIQRATKSQNCEFLQAALISR
jgi:hypothetical protein